MLALRRRACCRLPLARAGRPAPFSTAERLFESGNFAPVHEEHEFQTLQVDGHIPEELHGTYYRNGPNPQHPQRGKGHWFLGDGMVHAFSFKGGQCRRYKNRWVRTAKLLEEQAAGRALYDIFNPLNCALEVMPKVLWKSMAGGRPAWDDGVANTNVLWHGDRLLCLEEQHQPIAVDPFTLEMKGRVIFSASHPSVMTDASAANLRDMCMTAHPKIDPETGELVCFAYSARGPGSTGVAYFELSPEGDMVHRTVVEAPFSSMIHDFLVTKEYVVFPVLPLSYEAENARRFHSMAAWRPELGAKLGVLRRKGFGSEVHWINIDPCYVYHAMNAFDSNGKVVADVAAYDRAPLFPASDGGQQTKPASLTRWTIDMVRGEVESQILDSGGMEFPRIDDRRAGLPYRHGYWAAFAEQHNWYPDSSGGDPSFLLNCRRVGHIDHQTGAKSFYDAGGVVGEPLFVPRGAAAEEADGWLLTLVYKPETDKSELIVLDARDVAAGPVATVHLPVRVPFGFHGNWRPAGAGVHAATSKAG